MEFLRQATANGKHPAWALELDVASFFPPIHKPTLYGILCGAIRDPELSWLTSTILFHDPTVDSVFHKGPRFAPPPGSARYPVEARKRLFARGNETGLPIGDLTSQFWANFYLDQLDQLVKRRLGCRHYLRYVDDLVLLAPDPETLTGWREQIRTFAAERLRLRLRADGDEPFPVSRGIDFAGWKTWATHRVPRRRTLAALAMRLREAELALIERDESSGIESIDLTVRAISAPGAAQREVVAVDAMLSMLASYSGHLRWGGSWTAWHAVWNRHPWLAALCACDGWDVRLRWTSRVSRQPQLWRQYWALASGAAPGTLARSSRVSGAGGRARASTVRFVPRLPRRPFARNDAARSTMLTCGQISP